MPIVQTEPYYITGFSNFVKSKNVPIDFLRTVVGDSIFDITPELFDEVEYQNKIKNILLSQYTDGVDRVDVLFNGGMKEGTLDYNLSVFVLNPVDTNIYRPRVLGYLFYEPDDINVVVFSTLQSDRDFYVNKSGFGNEILVHQVVQHYPSSQKLTFFGSNYSNIDIESIAWEVLQWCTVGERIDFRTCDISNVTIAEFESRGWQVWHD